ncbi:histidine phosphatase family protein [Nocardioides yefusunii]|uniref:Histidine phosphatase family protein n=1 Tax=Nocardioides yefusunii TaxID=2500546 RepID=A0ABW1QX26_9ACTN|nr:histidine phosphatase family protein [Nocardioides yefusunii]
MSTPESTGTETTLVHVLRHGEVNNPEGILYGRRPNFHLSALGVKMAERIAESIGDRDIVHIRTSPLERAQETAAPLAARLGLTPELDPRVIESTNRFEGISFRDGAKTLLRHPETWRYLYNPFKPSWGEPYTEMAARMSAAVEDARDAARGHEAVVVSHQLPIWTLRLHAEKKSYLHDPRKRECTLCSLTTLHYEGDRLVKVSYSEPAVDLIPAKDRNAAFSAGGTDDEKRP